MTIKLMITTLFNALFILIYFLPLKGEENSRLKLTQSENIIAILLQLTLSLFSAVIVPPTFTALNEVDLLSFALGVLVFSSQLPSIYIQNSKNSLYQVFFSKLIPLFFLFYTPLLITLNLYRVINKIPFFVLFFLWLLNHLSFITVISPKILSSRK